MSEQRTPDELAALPDLLQRAVDGLGGSRRNGQVAMAEAVDHSVHTGTHLAVQAGTGTGKSLAYLVPALRHAVLTGGTVVVSTATIALQRQLIERDLPRLLEILRPELGDQLQATILKGRGNYLCRYKITSSAMTEPAEERLFDPFAASATGRQVARLHEWAQTTETGDRDELDPGVSDAAWRQVSVGARECLGAGRCPVGDECFAEHARARAGRAEVVVTNHALLAIDAIEGYAVLPEHDVVIIDEAHDLVDRVTSVATSELNGPAVAAAVRRAGRLVDQREADRLAESGEGLATVLDQLDAGRLDELPQALQGSLVALRDAATNCLTGLGASRGGTTEREDPEALAARRQAVTAVEELHDVAERILESVVPPIPDRIDVTWVSAPSDTGASTTGASGRTGRTDRTDTAASLHVAPMTVAGLLRERIFTTRTAVLTSATLSLGGSFATMGRRWGLGDPSQQPEGQPAADPATATATAPPGEGAGPSWTAMDAGSPFDYPSRGILYVARHLPPPGRGGLAPAYIDEIAELVTAAGGRTLGLFSSMRAAQQASAELSERLELPLLCQGEDSTAALVRRFAEDSRCSLFGTLSLWQGVDVPGPSLQLVIVDRLPFPRPDDPLASARQRAVEARGGNGFLSVAATHAALLLAQGSGRLLRTVEDRGVVAVLDPRLATARYGAFVRASLPPMWNTTDREQVLGALRRIDT